VDIWLPVAGEDAPVAAPSVEPSQEKGAGLVLLVDDEDFVRASPAEMLRDLGYEVMEATSARAAMQHLGDARLALVVTDHLMPGMTGAEFARIIQTQRPELPVLVISGYAEVEDLAPDLPRLIKPFRQTELSASLAALR
jgi:CheY-like chemotaxis protein